MAGTIEVSADRLDFQFTSSLSSIPSERGDELKERTIEALQRALEAAGVEFTNGDQPGVRLTRVPPRAPQKPPSVETSVAAKAIRSQTASALKKKR